MLNWNKLGYYKVTTVTPQLVLANIAANVAKIIELAKISDKREDYITVFPELNLTGYTCEDLFFSMDLIQAIPHAVEKLCAESKSLRNILIVGLPFLSYTGRLYNVAAVIYQGQILGLVPKSNLPNAKEFYEARWFSSGKNIRQYESFAGQDNILLSPYQIFNVSGMIFGIEICEDLWSPVPPSSYLALSGAELIVNLSASNELVGKKSYRQELIRNQSSRLNCAYAYANSGVYESSKDLVFGGHNIIAENGILLSQADRFQFNQDSYCSAIIDVDKLRLERRKNSSFITGDTLRLEITLHRQFANKEYQLTNNSRMYSKTPFVPESFNAFDAEEILLIQAAGLARRIIAAKAKKLILGLSGGLDSTLALLVALKALSLIGGSPKDVLAVMMPGFGTTKRTRDQAQSLIKALDTDFCEIDISNAANIHLQDIKHNSDLDIVYENAQARERTQILFDLANKDNGIVVGTGNLSELALGWCTYNGDHMSHYAVNGSIPKTLVKVLINHCAKQSQNSDLSLVLSQILDTPISPELLPPDQNGEIKQSTEEDLGPYELHDFLLFHYLRNGFSKEKITSLLNYTFKDKYPQQLLDKVITVFYSRIHSQQFKRTCLPPAPKVGSVSLSPRGDWRCPDEVTL